MFKIFFFAVCAFLVIWGISGILGAVFWWDKYSQHPGLFPLESHRRKWIDIHRWLYEAYGDKAVRKYVLFCSVFIVILGIWIPAAIIKENAKREQILEYSQLWQGETISFAGGALTLEAVEWSDGFTAKRFNVDKNRYDEVEVKADMHGEDMFLFKTVLTNNSSDTLSIVQEDLKFYAKPAEEGHNIKGRSAVDGYLHHDDAIELSVGESVPAWFWVSLTEEEERQLLVFVLEYGSTGCVLLF